MTTKKFVADIRELIAKGDLAEALTRLQGLLANSPKLNEVLLQSARHNNVLRQIRLGVVSQEDENITKNKITLGLLDLLSEVEEQSAKPAIEEELSQAISIVNSKNVLVGSTITSGRDTHIGDTTIHTESDASKRLRQFLFLLVPILVIGGTYWWFQYQEMQRPLQMSVLIENQSPNPQLAAPTGTLTLIYGGEPVVLKNVAEKAFFNKIPANYGSDIFRLQYEADGFVKVDTSLHYAESIRLPVRRNDDLAAIKGTIIDEAGSPLKDVQVSIDCCSATTTNAGKFLLEIPTAHQRSKQRLTAFKAGYLQKDVNTPVQPGKLVRLVLEKEVQ
jgi:hypothetical protein